MIFPTFNFLIFYVALWPAAWALVYLGRHNLHKVVIIVASYYFYAFWNWKLAFLLLASVVLNWAFGHAIWHAKGNITKKLAVAGGVLVNLSILCFFKYYGWFSEELNILLTSLGVERELPLLEIILPVGISFYTFQGISYIVDLYRGELDRSRRLIDVMFYISFFPQLVAGPIVRAASFFPQLDKPPAIDKVLVGLGVMLIVWGVFKKAIVANWLAVSLVDPVFFDPTSYGTIDLVAAVYGYAIQIYCDFSAYSDIAIGVAALLGYRFQRNFNQPYRAQTLAEFWRRWHISLSTWLRDYLYIPLGGSRRGSFVTCRNLMITMVLGGIWHGAAWKFVIWGTLHGGMLTVERMFTGRNPDILTGNQRPAWRQLFGVVLTFHFVCFCWIFFRAEDYTVAQDYLLAMGNWSPSSQLLTPFLAALIALGLFMHMTPPDLMQRLDRVYQFVPPWIVGLLVGAALLVIEAFSGGDSAPFIYFQF